MEIPVLVRSLKSSILSSTNLQMDKTFWGVVSAAVEQSRRKANMVAQGDGKFARIPPKKKKKLENGSTDIETFIILGSYPTNPAVVNIL